MAKNKKVKRDVEEDEVLNCPLCGCSTSGKMFTCGVRQCIDEKGCGWEGKKEDCVGDEDDF